MASIKPVLQVTAVASSLCLMAGFVAYRVSAARRDLRPARPPVDVAAGVPQDAATNEPPPARGEVLFSGSKSGPIVRTEPAAGGHTAEADDVFVLPMSSSKSGVIFPAGKRPKPFVGDLDPVSSEPTPPPPHTSQQASAPQMPRLLIGGSKSMMIVSADEVAQPVPAPSQERSMNGGSRRVVTALNHDVPWRFDFVSGPYSTDIMAPRSRSGQDPLLRTYFWWYQPAESPKPEAGK